jgi:translation initiation factor 3 subunit E
MTKDLVAPALLADVDASEPETAETLAKYDLTAKLTPHLDRHLVFQMLNFLQELEVETADGEKIRMYKREGILRAQLDILKETYMIDTEQDLYAELGEEAPTDMDERREAVLHNISGVRDEILPLLEVFENDARLQEIKERTSLKAICDDLQLDYDVFEKVLKFAKMTYDSGNYSNSRVILDHQRSIAMKMDDYSASTPSNQSMVWGLLASLVLDGKFEEAAEILMYIDSELTKRDQPNPEGKRATSAEKKAVLVERTWLLHWSLFIIFREPIQASTNIAKLLDWLFMESTLSAVSIACPHLFRYIGAALILHSKRLKHLLNSTIYILQHESHSYSDPVTRFLLALFVDIDFDEAQRQLQRCKMVCKGDFFLSRWWDDVFEENARLLIFEMYCRIHQCINIEMIASKLNMDPQAAELWIVKLIQSAKLDARIDSSKKRVVMSKAPPDVYQQVIEKTKNLCFRSTMLLSNLEKRERDKGAGLRLNPRSS